MRDQTIIIAETMTHRIRAIRNIDGVNRVITIAGSSYYGFRNGPDTYARFSMPFGIAIMPDQTIIVADHLNHRIRAIHMVDGIYQVSTIAGNGTPGLQDGPGGLDGIAQFNAPSGISVRGDQIIVADTGNNCIRIISADGFVSSIAGNITRGLQYGPDREARFNMPTGIAIMPDQTIIVADTGNNCICKISDIEQGPPAKKK
jgi:DNA-binding beta-propeller fold protein YncE